MRQKICKSCKQKFTPVRPLQRCCNIPCAIAHANALKAKQQAVKAKQDRADTREKKQKLKSRSEWLREAQRAFNLFCRLRDKGDPCISCGRYHGGQYHAGHFLSVGSSPELRFCEDNVHKQCAPCNNHLSGNIVKYRIALIKKIGLERVEWLEGKHEPLKLTIDEIRAVLATYRAKCKELERDA